MAKRDILRMANISAGNIPDRYTLTVNDIYQIKSVADNDDLYAALSTAFHAGFTLGARAQKKGVYKERRAGK